MRNEDELARVHSEFGKMSGTEKSFKTNSYMEDMNPVIDEKRLHEHTVGTTEINACGDMNLVTDSAQEAHKYLVYG